jgi:hypothetical protein
MQYQHFNSKFLLKNFTDNAGKTHIYKYKNDEWTEHNISNTAGDTLLYGPDNCSLEICFSRLENHIASAINKHSTLDNKDKAYMKIFISLMAFRSPSKEKIITENFNNFMKPINKLPKEDIVTYFEERKKEQDRKLALLVDDYTMREIVTNLLKNPFDDSDNSKFFPVTVRELLEVLPKVGNFFDVHIFECNDNLIIGETPTISVNLATNEIKTNGEEAGLINKNVIYWLPVAHNKAAFMYTSANIVAITERKLRKQDVDILNYFEKAKSPFFYSRKQNIEIPELQKDFKWINHFNYIFEYKNIYSN